MMKTVRIKRMNKICCIIYFVLIVFGICACEKERYFNCGLKTSINKGSYGLVEADVDRNVEKIYLQGHINLKEGKVEVNIINANNFVVYSEIIIAPSHLQIDETFNSNTGIWKLKYVSSNGIGDIQLLLHQ